jgi:hypothetical protein
MELTWLPRFCGIRAAPRLLWPSPVRAQSRPAALPLRRGLFRIYLGKAKQPLFKRLLFKRLLKHTVVEKLDCSIKIGAADPFVTSLLAGLIRAALGALGAAALTKVRAFTAQPGLLVTPLAKGGLSVNVECIFHLRAGDIIVDALYYLWLKKREARVCQVSMKYKA